jgi:hypothetical protein
MGACTQNFSAQSRYDQVFGSKIQNNNEMLHKSLINL